MAISKPAARKLTTQTEWTLLEASYPTRVRELTAGRLKQKITRARKLQDKYRDLARQQRGEARGKRQVKGTRPAEGNANTRAKQELFTEARLRFEAQLARVEAKAAKAGAAAKRKGVAKGKSKGTAQGTPQGTSKVTAEETAKRKAKRMAKRMEKRDARETSQALVVSARSRSARKSAALSRTGATSHHGHVGARGRRKQARRDSR